MRLLQQPEEEGGGLVERRGEAAAHYQQLRTPYLYLAECRGININNLLGRLLSPMTDPRVVIGGPKGGAVARCIMASTQNRSGTP